MQFKHIALLSLLAMVEARPGMTKGVQNVAESTPTPACPALPATETSAAAAPEADAAEEVDAAEEDAGGAAALVLPDGRIAADAVPEDFNVVASVFKSAVVKGDGLVFSDLIEFPDLAEQSQFDTATNTKAFEITIDDASIFTPAGGAPQEETRRADLLPSIISTLDDVATTGTKTMHFSVQADAARPLDAAHEYQLFFLESADFASNQINLKTGAVTGATAGNLVITGNNVDGGEVIFETPFTADVFHNFAITMDFDANTVEVFYSEGADPLASVTAAVANDLTGNGEYHFAVLKKAAAGAQPAGIDEGIIFGGIFMEDGAATLSG